MLEIFQEVLIDESLFDFFWEKGLEEAELSCKLGIYSEAKVIYVTLLNCLEQYLKQTPQKLEFKAKKELIKEKIKNMLNILKSETR
jgi:hypothetical protein